MTTAATLATPSIPFDDPDRPPLPAGDPLSWDLLVQGTWLAGTAWPGWGSVTELPVMAR